MAPDPSIIQRWNWITFSDPSHIQGWIMIPLIFRYWSGSLSHSEMNLDLSIIQRWIQIPLTFRDGSWSLLYSVIDPDPSIIQRWIRIPLTSVIPLTFRDGSWSPLNSWVEPFQEWIRIPFKFRSVSGSLSHSEMDIRISLTFRDQDPSHIQWSLLSTWNMVLFKIFA